MEQRTDTTIERVILRHLSGSKAGRADKLELNHPMEITIGRNSSSQIAYDPDQDDLVSTNHANIAWEENQRKCVYADRPRQQEWDFR